MIVASDTSFGCLTYRYRLSMTCLIRRYKEILVRNISLTPKRF